jgi:branched-chain amino acid transport system substrate-binding protein
MKTPKRILTLTCAAALASSVTACGAAGNSNSAGSGGGTVTVGESTSLSGAIANLGQTGLQGLQLAISDINAKGGLLGKKVKVVSADDNITPATGAANARSMITKDHVVALFGPVASSIATAEEQIAAQYKVPIFFHTSNDASLMTKTFTPYAFQDVPSTTMEPRAVADYLAQKVGGKQITIATFAPDYSFGHDTVDAFLQALKDLHVNYKLVKQEFPPLGASDISSNLSALVSAHPQFVFNAQYGGDLVAFTKQASSYGFFKDTKVIAMYAYAPLDALADSAPAGAIGFDRAPFWDINTPEMATFVKDYKAKYGKYPTEWAILAYASAQEWAYGVTKANSFDADKVSQSIPGAVVPSIIGPMTIRACDHQAEVPEYVGTISASGDPAYGGLHLYDKPVFKAPFDKIAPTCAEAKALQP